MDISSLALFKTGKIRELYSCDDHLLIVTTDRMSIRDQILAALIHDKGIYLTDLCVYWFRKLRETAPNHFVSRCTDFLPLTDEEQAHIAGRSMVVRRAEMLPVECIVRGYLFGSAWKDYQKDGAACSIALPANMKLAEKLPEPIFTPTTKSENGADLLLTFEELVGLVGHETADRLRETSLAIYEQGAAIAAEKGMIAVDTKFEFGIIDGELTLCDEVFTPDSSRFWPAETYEIGTRPPSYDKDAVRHWADALLSKGNIDTLPCPPSSLVQSQLMTLQQFHTKLLGKDQLGLPS